MLAEISDFVETGRRLPLGTVRRVLRSDDKEAQDLLFDLLFEYPERVTQPPEDEQYRFFLRYLADELRNQHEGRYVTGHTVQEFYLTIWSKQQTTIARLAVLEQQIQRTYTDYAHHQRQNLDPLMGLVLETWLKLGRPEIGVPATERRKIVAALLAAQRRRARTHHPIVDMNGASALQNQLAEWQKLAKASEVYSRHLHALKTMLASLYHQGDPQLQDVIVTSILEHLFADQQIHQAFSDWGEHPDLANAYREATKLVHLAATAP